jgi:hypothetical protein
MEMVGAGIASLAFWGFMAAAVIVGVWDKAKKREAQHETLRRMIAAGGPVDEGMMKRLMVGEPKRPDRELAIGAIVLVSIAVGLLVLGAVLRDAHESALTPLMGAAGVVACVAVGLWAASAYVKRARLEDGPAGQRMQAD